MCRLKLAPYKRSAMAKKNEVHHPCALMVTAVVHCVHCRTMVTIGGPDLVSWNTPSGRRYALQGSCPHHGQKCQKMVSKIHALSICPTL